MMTTEPEVQINLTKEQHKALVELVYLGHWMATAIHEKPIKKYDDVEQLVFSHAKRAGLQNCVDYDDEMKMYFTLRKFEESELWPIKEDYDDYTFWDELAHRLADRDMFQQSGDLEIAKMPEKLRKLRNSLIAKYEDESAEHGVDRLKIAE